MVFIFFNIFCKLFEFFFNVTCWTLSKFCRPCFLHLSNKTNMLFDLTIYCRPVQLVRHILKSLLLLIQTVNIQYTLLPTDLARGHWKRPYVRLLMPSRLWQTVFGLPDRTSWIVLSWIQIYMEKLKMEKISLGIYTPMVMLKPATWHALQYNVLVAQPQRFQTRFHNQWWYPLTNLFHANMFSKYWQTIHATWYRI